MGALKVWDGTTWQPIGGGGDSTDAFVGPSAPPGTPLPGDLWWDTDETAPGLTTPLGVTDGGTGATSPATARSSLAVPAIGNSTTAAGAPTTGTWARGDQWLDSNNVVWTCVTAGTPGVWITPGGELLYSQITANAAFSATSAAAATTVINPGSVTYDGSPIWIEFYASVWGYPNSSGSSGVLDLWDASTDLGQIGQVINQGSIASIGSPTFVRRRLTPSAGPHSYNIRGWVSPGGTSTIYAGVGGAGAYPPAYLRITRI